MAARKIIAFDTETGGLNWFEEDERAFLATWSTAEGNFLARGTEPDEVEVFLDELRSADVLIAHNLKFDVHQVRATWGLDILALDAELHDTDIMSRVLHPEGQRKGSRGGHGLKNLAKVYLKEDADEEEKAISEAAKSIGLRTLKSKGAYYKVWKAYPELMEEYALADTRYTYDLWELFSAEFAKPEHEKAWSIYWDLEMPVLPILVRAEERGVAVDPERVKKLRAKYKRIVNRCHKQLVAELGVAALEGPEAVEEYDGAAGNKTEALREAILMIGVPLYRKTDTGVLTTNKFALQEFEDDFPILKVLREWRTASKFIATYLDPMHEREIVHTSFNQVGAWTGRMSCSRPNMQNIPKGDEGVRSVFKPRPGHAFVVCDYSSIEAFLLAYYLGDAAYRKLVAEEDPHAWMASQIAYDDADHVHEFLKGTPGAAKRETAKNTTYAICYGAGAPRVSDMNKISKDKAKALISKIKNKLPGFWRLNKRIQTKVKSMGYVNTIMGRKNPVSKDKAYVGLNALIQGSAADIMKAGVRDCERAYRAAGLDAHVLLVVHDEIVVECPEKQAKKVLALTETALRNAYALDPALQVEGSITTEHYGKSK